MMKSVFTLIVLFLVTSNTYCAFRDYGSEYIDEWKKFYPSQALARGMHSSIFRYEDLSPEKIKKWLAFNKSMLELLSDASSGYVIENRIDARLLNVQIRSEIYKWEKEVPHRNSLSLYANLIGNAVEKVVESEFLTSQEKTRIICQRFKAVKKLCLAAKQSLTSSNRNDVERGLKRLAIAEAFYNDELPRIVNDWVLHCKDFASAILSTAESIRSLIAYVNTEILSNIKASDIVLGQEEYTRRLSLYTDSPLTPEKLAEMALEEIELVRNMIEEVSKEYLTEKYPNRSLQEDYSALVSTALADMEKDAPTSGEEYLEFWKELSASASRFVDEQKIATLPKNETLRILTAPESAGPAARIGWVSSAPPFDPNPITTLYLPSIPDTFSEQEKKDFWSSFNKPFNRIIVIHELFPGHYMQNKISRDSPHPVRLLFHYGLYSEGWATFCERVALDAGWEGGNKMTLLAHLRKRLENANRAYTSVQVHCYGWDQEKVMQFSTETSLLAPQFAKSLWGRLMNSPMQLISYFLGGRQFTDLLASEKERLDEKFKLIDFMDTILRSGPIPIDEFQNIFSQTISK